MTNPIHEAALSYAAKGWRVILIGGPKEPAPPDKTPGKWPRIEWAKEATTKEQTINRWWRLHPNDNVAVATGSSFIVLDIDGPHGEAQLEARGYEIPETLEVKTGKGRHLYFQGDATIRNKVGLINGAPGVDVRGEGGYVVVPPSVHQNGRVYEFSDPDVPMAPVPQWLKELCAERRESKIDPRSDEPILEGARDETLFKIACSYRAKGLGFHEINDLIQSVNLRRCKPPLSDKQVEEKARQAAKYALDEIEIPQNWGWPLDELKKRGADDETIAVAAKANEVVKKTLSEPGSDAVRLMLKRKWSRDSSRETELVATISVGNSSCVVPRLRGRDVLAQEILAALAYEQGVILPKIKRAEWRKLTAQAMKERQDEEVMEEETTIGACIVAAREWISSLDDTTNWKDFPSGVDRLRFAHGDGLYSVGAKQLREVVRAIVRDAKNQDVNAAMRSMGAFKHHTPGGATRMLRIKLDNPKG